LGIIIIVFGGVLFYFYALRGDKNYQTKKIFTPEDEAAFGLRLEQAGFCPQDREYQIGNSNLVLLVDTTLTKFALAEPYCASSIRIYEVSKIRRFQLDEDQRLSVTTSGAPEDSSASASVEPTYINIRIFMDDLNQPQLELQFLSSNPAFYWKTRQEQQNLARASANEVLSVLEYLTSRNLESR
jgi:hypothetical protein